MRNKNVSREAMKENLIFRIRRLVQTKTRIRPRLVLMCSLSILTVGNLATILNLT